MSGLEIIENTIRKHIREYIDSNVYLFRTDDAYTINCHLKPRLVSGAVEAGCSKCKQEILKRPEKNCYRDLFIMGINYATKHIAKQNNGQGIELK